MRSGYAVDDWTITRAMSLSKTPPTDAERAEIVVAVA